MPNKAEARESREARIARATELIQDHPTWGKDRVNAEVKKEFGVGLQRIFVAHLKRDLTTPKLTIEQKRERTMVNKGLLPTEAKALSKFPITSPAMKEYIKERKKLYKEAAKFGVSKASVNAQLRSDWKMDGYIKRGKVDFDSIFSDFVKRISVVLRIPQTQAVKTVKPIEFSEAEITIYNELIKHGFTKYEAEILAKGNTTVKAFNEGNTWRDAMNKRLEYVNNLIKMGWTEEAIANQINSYYDTGRKRTPFDHIRKYDSYKAPKPKADEDELRKALRRQSVARSSGRRKAAGRIQYAFGSRW